jgi:GH24 family phage-related lysozyme (muramidase)
MTHSDIPEEERLRLGIMPTLITIGYGHIRGVRQGMTITQEQAVQFLQQDLTDAETSVDSMTSSISTTNNQFAAMVSLCFDIGTVYLTQDQNGRSRRAPNRSFCANICEPCRCITRDMNSSPKG